MRWFIVPDLHGNGYEARALLDRAEVPSTPAARAAAGVATVQLGDLANCVIEDARRDTDILRDALDWFDVVLIGNHEHPYFGGPRFSGFWNVPEVREGVLKLATHGLLRPCLLVRDVLLTHAGVADTWGFEDAAVAARAINETWVADEAASLFSQIGEARGGWDTNGGVLWSDFAHEPRAPFRQIHGHTPLHDGPFLREPEGISLVDESLGPNWHGSLNLDTGAKSGQAPIGAWLNDDGSVEIVR